MKKIAIIGGGTFSHVRNHLSLAAPAFGETAKIIQRYFQNVMNVQPEYENDEIHLYLTKMADSASPIITNEDVSKLVDSLIADPEIRCIIFNPALVDFDGSIGDVESGKHADRLKTSDGIQTMQITPADKIIGKIRKVRKDIFVVGFKTTTGASEQEQYIRGLELLKKNSLNLVLANDLVTRTNMIIVPEETKYTVTTNRGYVLENLVHMTLSRMRNTFTRSTVVDGKPVDWNSSAIPDNLREVVNHCIKQGAYKPFLGKTAGHFAVKVDDNSIITSIRKTNYNELDKVGMVKVDYAGRDKVIAHGAKPSVGGMSQKIIFDTHSDAECIIHFHCEPKKDVDTLTWTDPVPTDHVMGRKEVSIRPQWWAECGSTNCGQNTSDGLARVDLGDGDYLRAVYLDNHGPNIVFSKNTPAKKVISYIDSTFALSSKTGGLVS